MDRAILSLVIVVALVGTLAGGTLVVGYRATNEALADRSDPLALVDEELLDLDRLHVGTRESELRDHGALKFERGKKRDGVRTWRADTDGNPRYRSVRVLVRKGKVVGLRVEFREPNVRAHDRWRGLLPAPYRTTDEDRHWETERLKLKATRDATSFYAVRKNYRNKLDW